MVICCNKTIVRLSHYLFSYPCRYGWTHPWLTTTKHIKVQVMWIISCTFSLYETSETPIDHGIHEQKMYPDCYDIIWNNIFHPVSILQYWFSMWHNFRAIYQGMFYFISIHPPPPSLFPHHAGGKWYWGDKIEQWYWKQWVSIDMFDSYLPGRSLHTSSANFQLL